MVKSENATKKMTELERKEFETKIRAFTSEEWKIVASIIPGNYLVERMQDDQLRMEHLKQRVNALYGIFNLKDDGFGGMRI